MYNDHVFSPVDEIILAVFSHQVVSVMVQSKFSLLGMRKDVYCYYVCVGFEKKIDVLYLFIPKTASGDKETINKAINTLSRNTPSRKCPPIFYRDNHLKQL